MSSDFEKLKAAFDNQADIAELSPSNDAKKVALLAAMSAFEKNNTKNFQENPKPARPISENATILSRLKLGVRQMISGKQFLYGGTAIASIAVAALIFQSGINPNAMPKPEKPTTQNNETGGNIGLVAPRKEVMPLPKDMAQSAEPAQSELLIAEARRDKAKQTGEESIGSIDAAAASSGLARGADMSSSYVETEAMPAVIGELTDDSLATPLIEQPTVEGASVNPLKITANEPVSTFSIDVDTASYARVRQFLDMGQVPSADMVRAEEMINYFPYDYAEPQDERPFATQMSIVDTPWNKGTKLVHVAIQGKKIEAAKRAPIDLVFLIDTSGSMEDPGRLPLLKSSFKMMLSQLHNDDRISIVTYAGSAGVVLEPTAGSEQAKIMAAINNLEAGGSTNGAQGIELAYQLANANKTDGRTHQVMLATDGDFNVGIDDPDALQSFIEKKREEGTYLSVLGFGMDGNDAIMQRLAQNGNGKAYYIDGLTEARKALVDELTGALVPIANDVKIQIEFNPAQVAEYRLIGYETRGLAREDFNNDKVDAGEIGAGHQVTAIYEITPVGSEAVRNGDLRYQAEKPTQSTDEIGFIKLRYKTPGDSKSQLIEQPIVASAAVNPDVNFSIAIAGFAQVLRKDKYMGDWTIGDAIKLAETAKGQDQGGYRNEAIGLMKIAESIE